MEGLGASAGTEFVASVGVRSAGYLSAPSPSTDAALGSRQAQALLAARVPGGGAHRPSSGRCALVEVNSRRIRGRRLGASICNPPLGGEGSMAKDHRPSVKNDKQAKVANTPNAAKKGGKNLGQPRGRTVPRNSGFGYRIHHACLDSPSRSASRFCWVSVGGPGTCRSPPGPSRHGGRRRPDFDSTKPRAGGGGSPQPRGSRLPRTPDQQHRPHAEAFAAGGPAPAARAGLSAQR